MKNDIRTIWKPNNHINSQPIICGWFQSYYPLWFWAGLSLLVFTTFHHISCIMLYHVVLWPVLSVLWRTARCSPVVSRRLPPRCAAPLALAVLCRAAARSGEQLLVRRVLPRLGASLHGPGAWGAPFEGTPWRQSIAGRRMETGGILGAWWDLLFIKVYIYIICMYLINVFYMYLWYFMIIYDQVLISEVMFYWNLWCFYLKERLMIHDGYLRVAKTCILSHPWIVSCWSTACWFDHTKWLVNLRLPVQSCVQNNINTLFLLLLLLLLYILLLIFITNYYY